MKEEKIIQVAIQAGKIMMENGAETYRVEDTMHYIINRHYTENIGVHATTTGLFVSISGKDDISHAAIRNLDSRSICLERVAKVNALSRAYVAKQISMEELEAGLCEAESLQSYSPVLILLGYALIAFGYVLLLDGSLLDAGIAFCTALISAFGLQKTARLDSVFLQNIIASFLVGLCTKLLTDLFPATNLDIIVIGIIMMLVPGTASITALRDILAGDYTSGVARTLEALLCAAAIALGVILGVLFYHKTRLLFWGL